MENLGSLSLHQRKILSLRSLKLKESKKLVPQNNYLSEKAEFEKQLNKIAFSYYNFKLSHSGIISYKGFENCHRPVRVSSLNNLLNFDSSIYCNSKGLINFDDCLGFVSKSVIEGRKMSKKQSLDCKKACSKLCYYSGVREFKSGKSGKYKFKVAFISLTAPENTTIFQFLNAFDLFLDYLRRTCNCVFVWKKEIGEEGRKLHVHILVNNFIPYYLIDWKWKKLLIYQGVIWPKNIKGVDTSSHYRVELPRSKKAVNSYISKYMAKDTGYINNVGYLWGKSKIISDCKESVLIEGEVVNSELFEIYKKFKTVGSEWVKVCCVDLLKVDKLAPELFKIFEKQFFDFQYKVTLPQRFFYV